MFREPRRSIHQNFCPLSIGAFLDGGGGRISAEHPPLPQGGSIEVWNYRTSKQSGEEV